MHYTGQVYRPPLEAYTPLLEVTYGCSHNKCAFCSMYHRTEFGVSPIEDVESDIIELANSNRRKVYPMERIYLVNGDPFVLSADRLLEISDLIHKHIPEVKTITCYCSFYNLKNKTVEDLIKLKEAGYNEMWFGVESGNDDVLAYINKGSDLAGYYEGLDKLKAAGINYHAIIMLGIAGAGNGKINAERTAEFLNYYPPYGLSIMTTSVNRGSPLYHMRERGDFVEATNRENLEEQIHLLENLDLPDETFYFSGHMVNMVNVNAKMKDKEEIIAHIQGALDYMDPGVLETTNQTRPR